MTPHDWFIEQRAAFVARTLEPDEERSFREHLTGCADCRAGVERIEQDLAWLPLGAQPVTPRPGLTRTLVAGALGRRHVVRRRLATVVLAASVALTAGAWIWATAVTRRTAREMAGQREHLARELAMVRDTLEIIRSADKVRHASIAMGPRHGGLMIFADDRTHRWNVVVYGLAPPVPGEVCQFWFITDSGMVRGVEVKTGDSGPAFLTLAMPPGGRTVMGAALTLEPSGSSGPTPRGRELAHLMM
jgi:hypothetical protein